MVYVISKSGKPLMPTRRHGKVRRLLKSGLAVPISNMPFTIRLKYETTEYTQDLWLGIDPGRENIGFGVSKENGECVFLAELKTNNKSVKKNMDNRRSYRHQRRHYHRLRKQRKALRDNTSFVNGENNTLRNKPCKSRNISYPRMEKSITCKVISGAEAQFSNRKKRCELTPSARQLVQMHLLSIQKIMKFLPVTHIIIERNCFDFQKLENQDIKSWQYSKGILYGYKDYKQYVYELQNGRCLLCGCLHIDNYHHVRPLSEGGSDTPSNIAGLCDGCHNGVNGVHKNRDTVSRLLELKEGLFQKYKVGLLNTVMPSLIDEVNDYCVRNNISFSTTDGYETFKVRERHELPKRHSVDGYVISISDRNVNIQLADSVYIQQRFKKKSAASIQKLNFRGYYILQDGKEVLVARNRHKAEGQMEDSLEEYMLDYSSSHSKEECMEHLKSLIVKPAKRTYLAHKYGMVSGIHTGDIVKYEKHNKVKGNVKQDVFVATGIRILSSQVISYTKAKKSEFCRKLSSSCVPYINKVPI